MPPITAIASAPSTLAERRVEVASPTQALVRVPRAVSPALRFHDDARPLDLAQHLVVLAFSAALAPWVGLLVDVAAPVVAPVIVASLSASLVASARRHGWRPDLDLRLRVARRALARRQVSGLRAMRSLVDVAAPEVATEARGRLALEALCRGDVAEAITWTRAGAYNHGLLRQRRGLGRGLVGEVVRSVLAWISPDPFAEVAHSSAFRLDPAQRADASPDEVAELLALVALLRVLEATAGDSDGLLAAWEASRRSELAARFPALGLLALAAVARAVPAMRRDRDEALEAAPAEARALVGSVFAELRRRGEPLDDAYRRQAPTLALVDAAGSRASSPPAEIMRAAAQPGVDVALERWRTTAAWRRALTPVLMVAAALGLTSGVMWLPGAAAVLFAALAGRRAQLRRRRVEALADLRPRPPQRWLAELRRCPTAGMRSAGGDVNDPLDDEALALFTACIRAEQALERGALTEAWSLVAWWFERLAVGAVEREPLYAVGSSLVRIAALSGHVAAAERLAALLSRVSAEFIGGGSRTCYGCAPRARSLALAVVAARRGDWAAAGRHLGDASVEAAVWQPEHLAVLHSLLAREVASRGGADGTWRRPAVTDAAVARWSPWVRAVWPELLGDPRLALVEGGASDAR